MLKRALVGCTALLLFANCSNEAKGLSKASPANTTVAFDVFARPLPNIPLPNDFATRVDRTSATGMRINASMIAPTEFESTMRELIDRLDGWGTFQPITIPFTGPLDVNSIIAGHRDTDYDLSNDVVYVINIDPSSSNYGKPYLLDLGNGNYPVVLEEGHRYWEADPRGDSISLLFEETNEDLNGNGVLDPGEDTDADGLLDVPNYLPRTDPNPLNPAERADALMTFYEKQTNTLIVRLMEPLEERTTYAVVVTRRLRDEAGDPVGSPFEYTSHSSQTKQLEPLLNVLPDGLALGDIAFAFPFTTQTTDSAMVAVRDGLYGHGIQSHIGEQYPAKINKLFDMRDRDYHGENIRAHLMYAENWLETLDIINEALLGYKDGSQAKEMWWGSYSYVDYFVMGEYDSPQLFKRYDENGDYIEDYNLQSWPEDLDRVPAELTTEKVKFTLMMPRKEISKRGEGQQVPVVIMSHGYTSSRFEVLTMGTFLAKFGIAVIGIDGPSHGLSLTGQERSIAANIFKGYGLGNAGEAFFLGRAIDHNKDDKPDSGADFWTSYLFHTRDVVRQFAVDYMQLIRIMRTFDGINTWDLDVNGDGKPDLAGDFDGDGIVDIGTDSVLSMTGGSLGGIMAMIMGGLEPELSAVMPIAGGAGLMDVGFRSRQGGVPEGFFLLGTMGPLFVGNTNAETGDLELKSIVADLNNQVHLPIANVSGIEPGDIMVVTNIKNDVRTCGVVSPEGTVRNGIEADRGDPVKVSFYRDATVIPGSKCELTAGATLLTEVDSWSDTVEFQGDSYEGDLIAMTHGLGRRRAHPDLRKLAGIAQMVIDPMDPVTFAPHLEREPLRFPGTGQETGTNALVITTLGDMNVPASSGVAYARAAGIVSYQEKDSRFGEPLNKVLVDNYVTEAVHNVGRFFNEKDEAVHIDVDNFSEGTDLFGAGQPRLDPPVRAGMELRNRYGGTSAAIFPMGRVDGQHGFDMPGRMADQARSRCEAECEAEGTCGCDELDSWDIGKFMLNMLGAYAISGGETLSYDLCQAHNSCSWEVEAPELRDPATLP